MWLCCSCSAGKHLHRKGFWTQSKFSLGICLGAVPRCDRSQWHWPSSTDVQINKVNWLVSLCPVWPLGRLFVLPCYGMKWVAARLLCLGRGCSHLCPGTDVGQRQCGGRCRKSPCGRTSQGWCCALLPCGGTVLKSGSNSVPKWVD